MREPTLGERVHGSARLRRRQAIGRGLARSLGRVAIENREIVPSTGGVLLAVNHRSMLDGPLLFGFVHRPVNCLVKSEAFTPRMAGLLLSAGQIPVVRGVVDARPVRQCIEILRAGGVVAIFPEGTRGDGLARQARPGVGYLALRTGAMVIPVACTGTPAMAHRRTARRPAARILFGTPMSVTRHPDARPLNRRLVAAETERIRLSLAELVHRADGADQVHPADARSTRVTSIAEVLRD